MQQATDSITLAGMLERNKDKVGLYAFLIVDTREHPWFVWAASRAEAIECVGLYDKWRGNLPI